MKVNEEEGGRVSLWIYRVKTPLAELGGMNE